MRGMKKKSTSKKGLNKAGCGNVDSLNERDSIQ